MISPKIQKVGKRRISRERTYFFGFYGPKTRGGGFLVPESCPKISKTVTGLYFSKQARTQTPEIITSQLVPKLANPFVRGHVISTQH